LLISILIPTHNRCDILARTLESIGQISAPAGVEVEVLVVANACTDATVEVSESALAGLPFSGRVIVEDTPGLNVARTRAVNESRGEVCALLDDDVWLEAGWLQGLHDGFTRYPADVVGGKVDLWWEEVEEPDWLPDCAAGILSSNQLGDAVVELKQPWGVIGANFAFTRDVFDRVGGFTPGLDRVGNELMGGGESEFVQRVQAEGHRVFYIPAARVKHWVARHRITREYFIGVSRGKGFAQVMMKPRLSWFGFARSIVGHAWLGVKHTWLLINAKVKRDRGAVLSHQCGVALARGGLVGLGRRVVKGGRHG